MVDKRIARKIIDIVIALGKYYGVSLSHEDGHGAFLIEPFSEKNANWLRAARCAQPVADATPQDLPETPRRTG